MILSVFFLGVGESMNLSGEDHEKDKDDENDLSLVEQTNLHHDNEESKYLERVCDSYRQYSTFTRNNRIGNQRRIFHLPESQKRFLPPAMMFGTPEYHEREKAFQDAEIRNQFFLDSILQHAGVPHSQQSALPSSKRGQNNNNNNNNSNSNSNSHANTGWSSDENISKVSSVLKSVSRDWSSDGSKEREVCIQSILSALQKYLPIVNTNQTFQNHNYDTMSTGGNQLRTNTAPRICVPGAGTYVTVCFSSGGSHLVMIIIYFIVPTHVIILNTITNMIFFFKLKFNNNDRAWSISLRNLLDGIYCTRKRNINAHALSI